MEVGTSTSRAAAWVAALLVCGPAFAGPVSNGGFETGDFSSWTTTIDPSWDAVDTLAPQAGTYAAYFGNASVSSISQSLATQAGLAYTISFWLMNEADVNGVAQPNSFEFDWGGATEMSLTNAPVFGYTNYQYTLLAGSPSTDLTFKFSQAAAFWDFDSVDVELAAGGTVPEPGTFALVALAGALALVVSKRRSAIDVRRHSGQQGSRK
ncbi:PEP-CTERM sorting domain-containing protein [Scleromatobacter humisilvae]|uniref:PEP-CTERM sorting domain-containing protein n=1 Tax=Scleromatobacter humisilvae TaxID=2897159 RepID=A0A9X1YRL8_9BURK|nr:PEP-CTERM sorting domain-containing protein [Scleromatobacter humisilvae]MCK9687426.1 PEP-CTERM sorting domain-containing protein [Scleromatobacter humisilvae]